MTTCGRLRPSIHSISSDSNYRFRPRAVIRISCSASDSYERFIANGLDPARNEFVHPSYGFSGANEDYKVPDPEPGTARGVSVS